MKNQFTIKLFCKYTEQHSSGVTHTTYYTHQHQYTRLCRTVRDSSSWCPGYGYHDYLALNSNEWSIGQFKCLDLSFSTHWSLTSSCPQFSKLLFWKLETFFPSPLVLDNKEKHFVTLWTNEKTRFLIWFCRPNIFYYNWELQNLLTLVRLTWTITKQKIRGIFWKFS